MTNCNTNRRPANGTWNTFYSHNYKSALLVYYDMRQGNMFNGLFRFYKFCEVLSILYREMDKKKLDKCTQIYKITNFRYHIY